MDKKKLGFYVPNLLVLLLSSLTFYVLLKVQGVASEYLPKNGCFDSVYFPAGIVFIAILVGRVFGAIGIFFGLMTSYISRFPDTEVLVIVGMVSFSMFVQLIVINSFLLMTGVGKKLENLTFLHVTALALIFSLSHSLCHLLNLSIIADQKLSWFESRIILSTLLGVYIILFALWLINKIAKYLLDNAMGKSNRY